MLTTAIEKETKRKKVKEKKKYIVSGVMMAKETLFFLTLIVVYKYSLYLVNKIY